MCGDQQYPRSKQIINEEKQQDSQRKSTPRLNQRPLRHRDMLAECRGLSCSLVEPLDHEVHRDSWHLLEDVTWASKLLQSREFKKTKNRHKGHRSPRAIIYLYHLSSIIPRLPFRVCKKNYHGASEEVYASVGQVLCIGIQVTDHLLQNGVEGLEDVILFILCKRQSIHNRHDYRVSQRATQ